MITQKTDSIGADPQAQRETHSQILGYAQETPTVYLPSHDPDAKARLEKRMPIIPPKV